jgi:3-hydroxyacyl-[acyl-carrier-protein] dehydratase
MLINESNILHYIPQREPMVMIDTLVSSDETKTLSSLFIKPDNQFCFDNVFTEPGLIENIAQTAALRVGYHCKLENVPVPIGFIGAIKNLTITKRPLTGSVITTCVELKHQIFDASIIQGTVTQNEEVLAECEMKIFIIK